ncbi:uncharacterized protein LOC125230356 [Leguminivora glycinivorella]|uniref:uncharacterized protein LOC125230356 n=1 Tax=Leguminivora glycinivorella TaxID=1035111 RepID=UPI00200C0A55|nr:uncharacterized protein LOC125230356 [Leguminivora glycinivorella]
MPKRKQDKEYKHLLNKIKKLERKVSRKRIISTSSEDEDSVQRSSRCSSAEKTTNSALAALGPQDWLATHDTVEFENDCHVTPESPLDEVNMEPILHTVQVHTTPDVVPETTAEIVPETTPVVAEQIPEDNVPGPSSVPDGHQDENITITLASDVLEILGEDPSATKNYGPDVHTEIATRFQHIATNGLSKEMRKELMAKYLTPENCCHIAAPALNPEIKAAIPENFVKRDKGIETKQSQLASAIACLSEVLSSQLNSKTKNNDMLSLN